MNKKIKAILLKPGEDAKVVELNKQDDCYLSDMYRYLECDTVDVATADIGGKVFDLWIDDEGLLHDKLFTVAFNIDAKTNKCHQVLAGCVLITTVNHSTGETTGLSEEDISLIKSKLAKADAPSFENDPVYFRSLDFGEIRIKHNSNFLVYQLPNY